MGITALLLPKSWLAAEKMETNSKSNQVGSGGALVAKLCLTLATLWTVASQAPLSMGFPRQEYSSGLQFPAPGDLPNLGIELVSPVSPELAGGFFTTEPPGKPSYPNRILVLFLNIFCSEMTKYEQLLIT